VRAAVIAVIVAAALAGCGGDDEQTSSSATAAPPPSATATPSETPTATPTQTPSATEQPSPTATSPEDQPGGAGDEEAIRVPAEFTVRSGSISPPQVAVPAFLTIELTVHNETSQPVVVRLQGAEPLTVGAGDTGRAKIEGRKKGRYVIDMGEAGQALLVTGAEPGP
jgi:hypothetical protein